MLVMHCKAMLSILCLQELSKLIASILATTVGLKLLDAYAMLCLGPLL